MLDLSSFTLRVKEASRTYYEVQRMRKHGEYRAVTRNVIQKVILSFHTQIPVDKCETHDFHCMNILQMKYCCMLGRKLLCFCYQVFGLVHKVLISLWFDRCM